MQAFNLLSNGHGGIDWAGYDRVCAHLGIAQDDQDHHADLIDRLAVIKNHNPNRQQEHGTGNTVD